MDVARPEFVPDPALDREAMERLQREVAATAVFGDDIGFDPRSVGVDGAGQVDERQRHLSGSGAAGGSSDGPGADGDAGRADAPLVAGVDQAFVDNRAVSAVVLLGEGRILERASAVEPVEIPYVPGLLSFREGGAILAALAALDRDPDVVLVDGSGRIHFREAGLATHVGVTLDLPTVGVAKSLLCGRPRDPLDGRHLPAGARVAVEADADVTAPDGTVIGYAVQTRQFEGDRHVNPLYVSPGHRTSAETAADIVERCTAGYKLPEPTRLADAYADDLKAEVGE